MKQSVLVVEDEKKISKIITAYLEKEGYDVRPVFNGKEAVEVLKKQIPDIVILDIMLPGIDGLEILKRIRQKSSVPVILLTAKSEEVDKILGLELGADDYVSKPFSPRELVARVKAVLRRKTAEPSSQEEFMAGPFTIDSYRHQVRAGDKVIPLTVTEFEIFKKMASNPGRVFSRLQLVEAVQGYEYEGYERTIDAHIKNLRQKIEKIPANPSYIRTVYGVGYKFEAENED